MTIAFGGDPTPVGWTITVAYAIVAWRCWRTPHPRWFWTATAVALALLCVNKQLDLQTEITASLRSLAKEQGWYATRRGVQVGAVIVALLLVAFAAGAVLRALRNDLRWIWPAVAGWALIGTYIALRITSLHETDVLLVGGWLPMKWWAELLGLALIAWAARRMAAASSGSQAQV